MMCMMVCRIMMIICPIGSGPADRTNKILIISTVEEAGVGGEQGKSCLAERLSSRASDSPFFFQAPDPSTNSQLYVPES